MAEKFLRPLNDNEIRPEATQTIAACVDGLFFPELKERVRQSTYRGYLARWEVQLKPRCGDMRLRDFRVLAGQQVINDIHRQNPEMKYSTLGHLKNLLSVIFDEAERLELLPRGAGNPIKLVRLPDAQEDNETHSYGLREVETMLAVLPEPAATVCAVAAFAGLRRAELRGVRWEDYDGEQIMVMRSVWEGFTNDPKTKRSKAPVPVSTCLAGKRGKVQYFGLRGTEETLKKRGDRLELLAAGLQKADQDALRLRPSGRAISTPYLASYHHRSDGLFRSPVRGLQAGTVQEGEESVALAQKMIGQASIPRGAIATLQAPIESCFQSSAGHGYTPVADLFLLATIAQLESLLQEGLYTARKFRFPLSRHQNHLPTAS
jgi:integrase